MQTTTVNVTQVPREALDEVAPYAKQARIIAGGTGEDSEAATMRFALSYTQRWLATKKKFEDETAGGESK